MAFFRLTLQKYILLPKYQHLDYIAFVQEALLVPDTKEFLFSE